MSRGYLLVSNLGGVRNSSVGNGHRGGVGGGVDGVLEWVVWFGWFGSDGELFADRVPH